MDVFDKAMNTESFQIFLSILGSPTSDSWTEIEWIIFPAFVNLSLCSLRVACVDFRLDASNHCTFNSL